MREIRPVARRFPLDAPPDDRAEWREVPLEERLRAVWEMALFWARLRLAEAEGRGRGRRSPSTASSPWRRSAL